MTALAARMADPDWVERVGRAGWVAKAAVYALTAVLAARVALGDAGQPADQQGALRTVADQPFGRVLLLVLALGLLGYALWRGLEASLPGSWDAQAKAKRAGYAVSGLVYAGLALGATSLALSGEAPAGGGNVQGVTGRVLGWPGGRPLVGLVGVAVLLVGAAFAWRGATRSFLEDLRIGVMARRRRARIEALGVVAWCARGAVFALLGWFVIKAALDFDAGEAEGLDGALRRLASTGYGPALLLAAAAGLAAYALWCLVEARYRRFAGPSPS